MHAGTILFGLIAATVAAPAALAQQATPTPAPAAPPTIITLPDTGTGSFSLAPRASPTPTPTPVAAPTPAAASPVPRPASVPQARRSPEPRIAPAATPTPAATPVAAPVATTAPATLPTAIATPAAAPVAAASAQQPAWLWVLMGAGGTALAGLAAWLLLRRRRAVAEEAEVLAPVAFVPPPPPVAPARTAPASVAVPSGEPFELGVQPLALRFGDSEIVLDLELVIANLSGGSADAVRVATVLISANADQDAQIAAFQANSQLAPAAAPFDLASGAGGRMPVRLTLPRAQVEVVTVSGRPMFVPLVMIGIHWRGGLAVRRFGASYMIGTGGQGGKLGPIWLDRPAPRAGLAATRYFRREAAAA